MIDVHTHILPGIDDGSKSVEMSLEMLRISAAQGVKTVVATPHFYPTRNNPEKFYEDRQRAWEQLGQLPDDLPQVLLGAEVTYFEGMSRSAPLEAMRLGSSDLLLVEMPMSPWTDYMIDEVVSIPGNLGLQPVLAHVDRYLHRSQLPRYLDYLLSAEVLIQANAESFLEFSKRGKMLKLVKNGLLDFLGSDTHNLTTRAPNMADAARVIAKKLGEEALQDITARSASLLGL